MSLEAVPVKRCTDCIELSSVEFAMVLSWHDLHAMPNEFWSSHSPWKGSIFCGELVQSVANIRQGRPCNPSWPLPRAHIRNCLRGKHEVKAASVLKATFIGVCTFQIISYSRHLISQFKPFQVHEDEVRDGLGNWTCPRLVSSDLAWQLIEGSCWSFWIFW